MKITKTENDGFYTIEITDGMVNVGFMSYTNYDITLGGAGESKQEALEELKKNLRILEANIIPDIKDQLENE